MKFEFLVALKYLVPRLRQLSVSIISLVSIIVISLVVWLVIVFLSVTDGIEKKWTEELISLNAPIRITPTDAYYNSYYHQIDLLSLASNYESKTLGEKKAAAVSNPYDPSIDPEIPTYFPSPDLNEDGSLKDLVKELHSTINALPFSQLVTNEYEVSFANLRLSLIRDNTTSYATDNKQATTFLSQVSYIATIDPLNPKFQKMVLQPSENDLKHLYNQLSLSSQSLTDIALDNSIDEDSLKENLKSFFSNTLIKSFKTPANGWQLPEALYPQSGLFHALAIVKDDSIQKFIIPQKNEDIDFFSKGLEKVHAICIPGTIKFFDGKWNFISKNESLSVQKTAKLYLAPGICFSAKPIDPSFDKINALSSVFFDVEALIQGNSVSGTITAQNLELNQIEPLTKFSKYPDPTPFWTFKTDSQIIPSHSTFGDGILLSKNFQANGVRIGDKGHLSFYTSTAASSQEQRLPVYVAGFYDQGLMPIGTKLIFASPQTVATLRGSVSIADKSLGNGFYLRFPQLEQTEQIKAKLIQSLNEKGLGSYWNVESFYDYDFSKPILQQLKSDKNLFTLIAIIILLVACSNIISMLILLVNDKRKEIGILQSMGASSKSIAIIFGLCGFLTGMISCLIGSLAAIFTLKNLQNLVDFLSFIQGHEAFQTAFYGSSLPNELSFNSLLFVIVATVVISLLAGIAPAIKASLLKPSQILRGE